jgi:uncharacterized RDD family membrane protein YckC
MRTGSLQIRTPEGIVFSQTLAGPVTRFLAWIIDACCISGLVAVVGAVFLALNFVSPGFASALSILSYFVISVGYGILCEWAWRGQTVGKRTFRLRVVDAEGLRLQFNQVVTRNLLRYVDCLPFMYFIGGVICWFSPRCQRLGDIAANTIVVRHLRQREPDLDQIMAGKFNSLRTHPHLAARLRQRITPPEAALALQALIRRDDFEPVARVELFSELAAHFRQQVEFPAEATDGIADEQYVRNVVDVLYRAKG